MTFFPGLCFRTRFKNKSEKAYAISQWVLTSWQNRGSAIALHQPLLHLSKWGTSFERHSLTSHARPVFGSLDMPRLRACRQEQVQNLTWWSNSNLFSDHMNDGTEILSARVFFFFLSLQLLCILTALAAAAFWVIPMLFTLHYYYMLQVSPCFLGDWKVIPIFKVQGLL